MVNSWDRPSPHWGGANRVLASPADLELLTGELVGVLGAGERRGGGHIASMVEDLKGQYVVMVKHI